MFEDDKRGRERLKTDIDFLDSSWCYSTSSLMQQLIMKRKPAFITDLSTGGLSFLSTIDIELNAKVSTSVAYKRYKNFMLCGRVRASTAIDIANTKIENTGYYRISIQFLYHSPEATDELNRLINRLKKKAVEKA
jgi:hypothetical protein